MLRVLPGPVQREVLKRFHRYGPWSTGVAPVAPPHPIGMVTGPPDFVGVGVPKCGTTWWFSLIVRHPDIHVHHDKELAYFNRRYIERYRQVGILEEDLAAYREWFPRPEGTKTGEWTPHYINAYQLPPILQRAAPRCKVLVMVRDPLERYRSDISRRTTGRRLKVVRYRGMARVSTRQRSPRGSGSLPRRTCWCSSSKLAYAPRPSSWPPPSGSSGWTTPSYPTA